MHVGLTGIRDEIIKGRAGCYSSKNMLWLLLSGWTCDHTSPSYTSTLSPLYIHQNIHFDCLLVTVLAVLLV